MFAFVLICNDEVRTGLVIAADEEAAIEKVKEIYSDVFEDFNESDYDLEMTEVVEANFENGHMSIYEDY